MMKLKVAGSVILCASLAAGAALGQEPAAAPSEATTLALIRLLIEEGVLSRDRAQALLAIAEQQAAAAAANKAATGLAAPPGTPANAVRVPYVPEVVRKQIKDDVKQEVLAQAKTERWGDPGALPEWLDRLSFVGDVRVRGRLDTFDNGNFGSFPDFQRINDGDFNLFASTLPTINSTKDREQLQLRARLGVEADLKNGFSSVIRVATGNSLNPVSTNQTLNTYLGNDNINLDRAFIQYQGDAFQAGGQLKSQIGRFGNPFFSTELLYDDDLNFDGAVARYLYPVTPTFKPYLTAGWFPLQLLDQSARDKNLYAAQLGAQWQARPELGIELAAAYYDMSNVRGDPGSCNDDGENDSRPPFIQYGNSLYDISCVGDPLNLLDDRLQYGLASNFDVLNLTGRIDVSAFAPIHIIATGDFAINLGQSDTGVRRRVDQQDLTSEIYPKSGNTAYLAKVQVGHPQIEALNDWNLTFGYRYIESDAVLDAFNDSDFHLGGTNAKGFSVLGNYGISENIWLGARWYSSQEIDGPSYSVDTFMVEVNAKF